VRPTPSGRAADAIWRPLAGEIEARWSERFGADALAELRRCLAPVAGRPELAVPEFMPVVGGGAWLLADAVAGGAREPVPGRPLSALLARTLLAYTLEFEREAGLALPLAANVVRVLDGQGVSVQDVPLRAGISKEAVAMAATSLAKSGHAVAEGKLIRLTPAGSEAQGRAVRLHAETDGRWAEQAAGLEAALAGVLDQQDRLALGLRPPPEGWRARPPYLARTEALLADPRAVLPHYPLVLPRGGWPDGS
jgi:hypothetical protein